MAAHVQAITQRLPAKRTAWKALESHYRKVRHLHLRDLFAQDPTRGERMAAEAAGIYLDYSKNRITDQTITLLLQLAEESGLQARIDAMFRGEKINVTENRAALHVALRAPRGASVCVEVWRAVYLPALGDGETVKHETDPNTKFSDTSRCGVGGEIAARCSHQNTYETGSKLFN